MKSVNDEFELVHYPDLERNTNEISITTKSDSPEMARLFWGLSQVAKIMQPKRKRLISDKERKRLAEAGNKYRFTHGVQSPENKRACVPKA
jgi:hypothetical protein